MVKRTDFTESDDENLLKYIAQKKPENSGRLGNNLYILLEETADQRPWAKRHTWQSWRERYKKNQDWFNYQIKKRQKEASRREMQMTKPELGENKRVVVDKGQVKGGKQEKGEPSSMVNGKCVMDKDKEESRSNVEKPAQTQDKQEKREPNSTVNGDDKHETDKGKSRSNVEKPAQLQADNSEPEKLNSTVNGNGKHATDKGKSKSSVEKPAQAQVDKPEKREPNPVVNGNDKHTTDKGKSRLDVEKPTQVRDKPEQGKLNATVNGDNRHTTDKGKSKSNVDKLAQPQADNPEEKREHVRQAGSVPLASPVATQTSPAVEEYPNEEDGASEPERQNMYRELFGISQFSDDSEEDETLDADERPIVPSSSNINQDNIYPSIESVPHPGTVDKEVHIPGSFDSVVKLEDTSILSPARELVHESVLSSGRKPTATNTLQPLRPPRDKPKKKVLSQDDDSHFFGTPTPTPSPLVTNSFARGQPPVYHEGPYRSSLKRPRTTSENVNNDESWPPKRRKKTAEDVDMVGPEVEMSGTGDARGGVGTNGAVPLTLSATANTNGLARRRPPTPVNAVASSSKVLLPDTPRRVSKPTNLLKMMYAKETPPSGTSHKDRSPANSFVETAADNGPQSDAAPRPKAMRDTKSAHVTDKKKRDGGVAVQDSASTKRLITTPNAGAATLQIARLSPVDTDDPFIVNKSTNKGKTGTTINPISHDKPRRIDLRSSHNKNAIRRSSNFSSRTSASSTSRRSVTSFLLPEDQEMVNQVGFSEVMAVIAKHYGFDVDVAMNAFFATKSIEKTKLVLQHAKEVANSATSLLLAKLVNTTDDEGNGDDDDSYDEEPRNMRLGRSSSNKKDQSSSPGRRKARRSSGPKRRSLNIKIKPQLFDEVMEQNGLSDYSPPRVSRAGQFMRLVKQGRRMEAVDRERRRASGAFVAQTQIQSSDESHQQQQSFVPNSSPTNVGQEELMVIDSCSCDEDDEKDKDNDDKDDNVKDNDDNDGSQPPATTPHRDTVPDQQPPEDAPLPIDHHRIFLKRLSEGHSTLNEEEDDPAVVKLAQEHRDLVMNVTEENADALRSFEQKNNPDLLRLWSLDWMRLKIADI